MAELADATDSKSVIRKGVWVRVPLRAPNVRIVNHCKPRRCAPREWLRRDGDLMRFDEAALLDEVIERAAAFRRRLA